MSGAKVITQFTVLRDFVRELAPETRRLLASAIVFEEAELAQQRNNEDAFYAWNRVESEMREAKKLDRVSGSYSNASIATLQSALMDPKVLDVLRTLSVRPVELAWLCDQARRENDAR